MSFDQGTATGMSNDEIASSIRGVSSDSIRKNSAVIESDAGIATVTTGAAELPGLNDLKTYLNNTDKITASANIGVEDFFGSARLKTCTEVAGQGNMSDIGGDGASQVYASYSIVFDGDKVSFRASQNAECNVKVDGVYIQKENYTLPATGGSAYLNLDFGSRNSRVIEFQIANSGATFSGVYISKLDSIRQIPKRLKGISFGDSFGVGEGGQNAGISWPMILGESFKYDMCPSCRGATGFLASSSTHNFLERVEDAALLQADIVFATSSINDAYLVQSEVASNVVAWHAQVRAALPLAKIIVMGSPGRTSTVHAAGEQTVSDAINGIGDAKTTFIPVMTAANPPISGTGNAGVQLGDGNADLYIASDDTHFTIDGHIFYSDWVASAIISAL